MDLISGWGWLFVMQKRIVGVCGVLDSKAAERSLRVAQWEGHPLLCFPAVTCVSGRTRLNFSLILPPGMGGGAASHFPSRHHKVALLVYSVFLTKHPLRRHGALISFPSAQKNERWKVCNMVDD